MSKHYAVPSRHAALVARKLAAMSRLDVDGTIVPKEIERAKRANRSLVGVAEISDSSDEPKDRAIAIFLDREAAVAFAGAENASRWSDGRALVGVPTVQTYDTCEISARFAAAKT